MKILTPAEERNSFVRASLAFIKSRLGIHHATGRLRLHVRFCIPKDKYSLLYRTHSWYLLVLWPCYVNTYVRWGISFDESAAVLQIRRENRDNFGIVIHIFTVKTYFVTHH